MLRFLLLPLLLPLAWGQTSSTVSGVDLKAIDKAADPCQNFYQYACGNWMKQNPVPPQYARWGRFSELANQNQEVLHKILDDSVKNQQRSPIDQKLGAFYSACMDEAAIDKEGDKPIQPGLARIAALADKKALAAEVARLHSQGVPVFSASAKVPILRTQQSPLPARIRAVWAFPIRVITTVQKMKPRARSI